MHAWHRAWLRAAMDLFDRTPQNPAGYHDATVTEVHASLTEPLRRVDVREPDEWVGELGHIAGIQKVPLATVAAAAAAWPKEETIVLVCRSGGRSGKAAAALREAGFTRVINMVGGMLAWNAAALPTAR